MYSDSAVDVAIVVCRRALQETAAIDCPVLVFLRLVGWSVHFRTGCPLLDELAVLGAPQAAERYLLADSLAAVGVQKRLLRQGLV